jgi:hypothetical protein
MHLDFKVDDDIFMLKFQLREYQIAEDAVSFVALCRKAKATIIELIQRDMHVDAGTLFTMYQNALEDLAGCSPAFLLGIIEVLPQNSRNTFKLLGKSIELDRAIIAKLDLDSLFISKEHGFSCLLTWAVKNNDWPLVENTVLHLTRIGLELPYDDGSRQDLANAIVDALIDDSDNTRAFSPTVDKALSGLISFKGFGTRHPSHVERMAVAGLHQTLMKMLVHELITECPLIQFSEDRASKILAALPPSPTLVELRAIHHFLQPKGLSEQILFDESIDLDGYLDVMRNTRYLNPTRDDLSFHGIKPFRVCMTRENMNIPARRQQIAKLLNATYEEYFIKGFLTGDDAIARIIEIGIPEHVIKLIDRLKGQALEQSLGL